MTKRRGRGEGSIYQRRDGRWCAVVSLGFVDGKRKRQPVYAHSKAEVLEKLKGLGFQTPAAVEAPKKVADLLKVWLESVTLGPDTRKHYTIAVNHITNKLGGVRLSKLHAAQINVMYKDLMNSGKRRVPTLVHEVMRAALRWAKKAGYLVNDPLAGVMAPKRLKSKRTVWTDDQTRTFIAKLDGHPFEALFKLAACVGAREAEVLGARWEDIDLERAIWNVNRQMIEVDGKLYMDHEPKTEASKRPIALPELVVAALKKHKLAQFAREGQRKLRRARRKNSGKTVPWEKYEGLVFRTLDRGRPLRKSKFLSKVFHPTVESMGLPRIRFHDLRHGIATILLGKNIHPKKVQELLGHASVKITLDTYSHVNREHMEEVAAVTDELLGYQLAVNEEKDKGRA